MSVGYTLPPGMYSYTGGLPPLVDAQRAVYYPWNVALMYHEDMRAMYPMVPPPANWKDQGNNAYGNGLGAAFDGLNLNPRAKEYVPGNGSPPCRSPEWMHADGTPWRPSGKYGFRSRNRSVGWQTYPQSEPARKGPRVRKADSSVKKTIYICDIDQTVTEEQLASLFQECGDVVDCRVCGDPNSAMRFAFIEFFTEEAAQAALAKNGSMLGKFPLRVLPSKTSIVPVNNQYLPKTSIERELCSRTIYAANIDKKVDKVDVKHFFETLCGPVNKIRLLGDYQHATRIAFVEFVKAESARTALTCSGALLGSLPLRVSPSKTPVRSSESHSP